MDRKEIGKKIERLRKERKMSQYQLANDAGLSASYIPDLEKGLKCPTVETLDNICFALQISLSDFLTESEGDSKSDRISSLSKQQRKLLNDFLDSL